MLCIHQYRVHIIHKPGSDLYIADWLSQKKRSIIQGQGSHWHEHKHACHEHISKYTSMPINRRHTGSNTRGCRLPKPEIIHNKMLGRQKKKTK